jgi:hypothetical protein
MSLATSTAWTSPGNHKPVFGDALAPQKGEVRGKIKCAEQDNFIMYHFENSVILGYCSTYCSYRQSTRTFFCCLSTTYCKGTHARDFIVCFSHFFGIIQ